MGKVVRRAGGFDGATALDAEEVRALFQALRRRPGGTHGMREAYARVQAGLTPAGRTAYRRELARLQHAGAFVPEDLEELPDGEYGLQVHGDDASSGLATLRCLRGRLSLELPLDQGAFGQVELPVDRDGGIDAVLLVRGPAPCEVEAKGTLGLRNGFLRLEVQLAATLEERGVSRRVRRRLRGGGEARSGRA